MISLSNTLAFLLFHKRSRILKATLNKSCFNLSCVGPSLRLQLRFRDSWTGKVSGCYLCLSWQNGPRGKWPEVESRRSKFRKCQILRRKDVRNSEDLESFTRQSSRQRMRK